MPCWLLANTCKKKDLPNIFIPNIKHLSPSFNSDIVNCLDAPTPSWVKRGMTSLTVECASQLQHIHSTRRKNQQIKTHNTLKSFRA
jgi:hypothetical protein